MSAYNTARQFVIQRPGHGAIVETPLPERQDDQVLVRTLYSGVSRGTEAIVFRGEVPASQYQAMRAPFQQGEFPGPLAYGYMSVGIVEEASGSFASALGGRRVFCLHPHQDRYVVPASAVHVIPDGVPDGRGVLAANMETAVNVIWDAGVSVGDRVVVVGAGVVGLLIAWLARRVPGADVVAVDVRPGRAEVARALGIPFSDSVPADAAADVVVHASGNPEGLRDALVAAGPEGRIVEASWYGDRMVPLPLGEAFHSGRLRLVSSQVGRIPPARAPRWNHRRRMALALSLLEDTALDVLISDECAFEELPRVMAALSRSGQDALCQRVRYG